jgi:hypothetical protein
MASITLTRQTSDLAEYLHPSYRLKVTATGTDDVDTSIFVYLSRTLDPTEGTKESRFDHIASPADLEDFPVGAADVDAPQAFFRLDSVDLLLRSSDELASTWEDIVEDVRSLAASLANLEALENSEDLVIAIE